MLLFVFWVFELLRTGRRSRRRPDDRRQFTIHALDRRLARIESLLQTRLSDSRLEQQLIRIEGVLRERLPLRQ